MGIFERSRTLRKGIERSGTPRSSKKLRGRHLLLLFPFICILTLPLVQWFLSFPPPLFDAQSTSCSDGQSRYTISEHSVCMESCGKICFPRVRGMCVSRTQVTVCEEQPPLSEEVVDAGGGLPDFLRLITDVPRARVPVKRGSCPGWDSKLHEPFVASGSFHIDLCANPRAVGDIVLLPSHS